MGSTITDGSLASSTLVIPLATAKEHLRIASTDTTKDTLVTAAIIAAQTICENYLERYLLRATHIMRLDSFPSEIELPSPLVSVTIAYLDAAGASQTLSTDIYRVDTQDPERSAQRITLKSGQSWPSVLDQKEVVTVTYVSGWADPSSIPTPIQMGLKLAIQDVVYGSDLSMAYESLWNSYRRIPL